MTENNDCFTFKVYLFICYFNNLSHHVLVKNPKSLKLSIIYFTSLAAKFHIKTKNA